MKAIPSLLVFIFSISAAVCAPALAKEKVAPPLNKSGQTYIAIPEDGFGKLYLLSTSIIPQTGAATGTGSLGRVVSFEKFEDGVDLYETTKGQLVTEELPARRLLATFPIVEQNAASTVIDFNQGMRRMMLSDWTRADEYFNPSASERTAELPQSRVFEVSKFDDNLVIRQAVQARSRQFDTDREARYELRYFIAPYQPGDFEPKTLSPAELRYARYFETPMQVATETGRQTANISRFDITEPVVFYYSANTPPEMESAVREGILYWNRAFDKDVIQARKAPENVSAPDARYNIVQWVGWDSAGFAYADVLLDPISGQAQHGQAFMTSTFEIRGKARARQLLRSLAAQIEKAENGETPSDHGLHFARHLCRVDPLLFARELSKGLETLLADPKLTDQIAIRLAQDYVREVTAHEVGHVLGLRHNFAASLEATLTPKQLDAFMKDYISGADLSQYAESSAGSSTMEYNTFEASIFMGWLMKESQAVLAHDKAAIQLGYLDNKTILESKPLFGTDNHLADFQDVSRFDYGAEPVLASYNQLSSNVRTLPNRVIEIFIRARAPQDPRDRQPLESVSLPLDSIADSIARPVADLLVWFKKESRSRKVENDFDFVGELNLEQRQKAHWDFLVKQFESLGGVDQVAFAHLPIDLELKIEKPDEKKKSDDSEPSDAKEVAVDPAPKMDPEALAKRVEELLDSSAYANFVGLDDETYTWTDEEKKLIIERSKTLFAELEEAVLLATLKLFEDAPRDLGLAANGHLEDDDIVAQLETRIIDLAKKVVLAKSDDRRISGKVDKAFVEVPDFKYSVETRLAAAKALNEKTGSFEAWAKTAKEELHDSLKKQLDEALNVHLFKEFDDALLSRSLREWYLAQQNLLKMLPPASKKPNGGNGNGGPTGQSSTES